MSRGSYLMQRGWMDHPAITSDDLFTRREAWIWLLENAAWKDRPVDLCGQSKMLHRGQLAHSLRFLAKQWTWSEPAVRRFLARLKRDRLIDTSTDAGRTVITICKYDEDQSLRPRTDADNDAAVTRQRRSSDANKKEGNTRRRKNQDTSYPVSDDLLPGASVVRLPPDPTGEAVGAWNAMAAGCGLSIVQVVTPARRAALRARLRACGGLDGWRAALEQVRATAFLLGENDRGWKADFDFVVQAKSFTRLCEGTYGNRGRPKERSGSVAWMKKYLAPEPAEPGFDLDLTAERV